MATKPRVTRFKINWDDSNGSANGDNNLDEASASNELFTNNDHTMDHDENNDDNINGNDGGVVSVDARLNENSNSLAMEC